MALIGPPGFDVARMRRAVRDTYERLAADPTSVGHLNHGAAYAATLLGYDAAELATLPASATRAFVGVGNPHRLGIPDPDATVLDIGCGTGTDLLLTAQRLGPHGRVIGVDPTPTMRMRAREGARALGLAPRVDVRPGLAEELPLGSSSVDLVQTNGVLNLVVDKVRAFSEIHRVLKPGGRLHLADVLLHHDLHEHERMEPRLWAA
ncbi:MAG: methyltransferase domain-containing protein [Planctomycetota bacterium]